MGLAMLIYNLVRAIVTFLVTLVYDSPFGLPFRSVYDWWSHSQKHQRAFREGFDASFFTNVLVRQVKNGFSLENHNFSKNGVNVNEVAGVTTFKSFHATTADVEIMHLQYRNPLLGASSSLPKSVVIKHTPAPNRRATNRFFSFFAFKVCANECLFLNNVLPLLSHESNNSNGNNNNGEKKTASTDAVQIGPKLYYADVRTWSSTFSMVMEDMSIAYTQYKPLEVISNRSRLVALVTTLAQLHALSWNRPDLLSKASFLPDDRISRDDYYALVRLIWNGKIEKNPIYLTLSDSAKRFMQKIPRNCAQLSAFLSTLPQTIVHGDVHNFNMFFRLSSKGNKQQEEECVLIDWQVVHRNFGLTDLAYFFGFFPVAERRANERDLVKCYWEALLKFGVPKEYTFEACWKHYRYAYLSACRVFFLHFIVGDVVDAELCPPGHKSEEWNALVEDFDLLTLLDEIIANPEMRA